MRASTWGVLAALSGIFLPGHVRAQGSPGAFLRLMEGARPVGMGSAFVALADDVNTVFFNPAGLSLIPHREITGTHLELGFDRKANHFAFVVPNHPGNSAWAFSYSRLSVDGIPETRVNGLGQPILDVNGNVVIFSLFDTLEEATTVSYGWKAHEQIRFGATARLLRAKLGPQGSRQYGTGAGVDLGAIYQPTQDVRIGFSLRDMFESRRFDEPIKEEVPYRATLGAAIRGWANVVYTAEYEHDGDGGDYIRAGAEKWWQKHYAIRAGIDDGNFAAGASAKFQKLQFDYAYKENDLKDQHRMSLTYRW